MYRVSIIGLGFVGGAMFKSFTEKGANVYGYDKYKNGGMGNIEQCLNSELCFLALPTLYSDKTEEYNKSSLNEVCEFLNTNKYTGIIVIKSTVEPTVTEALSSKFTNLKFIHNPEFLTARTAYHDFHNQPRIILGLANNVDDDDYNVVYKFYNEYYPNAEIIKCTSNESESMKIFVNTFYATKIQIFNEFYLMCKKLNVDFNNVKKLMLGNKWINPRHTNVPGPDGKLSYGGACFPKDTSALLAMMRREDVPCSVLNGVVKERDTMRDD